MRMRDITLCLSIFLLANFSTMSLEEACDNPLMFWTFLILGGICFGVFNAILDRQVGVK